MICPHCKDEGRTSTVFPYDDGRVTCKFGHIQRESNAVSSVEAVKQDKHLLVPVVAFSAFGLSLLDLLLRLL